MYLIRFKYLLCLNHRDGGCLWCKLLPAGTYLKSNFGVTSTGNTKDFHGVAPYRGVIFLFAKPTVRCGADIALENPTMRFGAKPYGVVRLGRNR